MLAPGSIGALLVVQTNATTFDRTLASVIDGQVTSVASLAPAGPGGGIPEPCSVVLGGIGWPLSRSYGGEDGPPLLVIRCWDIGVLLFVRPRVVKLSARSGAWAAQQYHNC